MVQHSQKPKDSEQEGSEQRAEHGSSEVTIFYEGKSFKIHRGAQEISHIKEVLGVPQEYELDLLIPNQPPQHLPDDKKFVIKGEEHFGAHPRKGGNS